LATFQTAGAFPSFPQILDEEAARANLSRGNLEADEERGVRLPDQSCVVCRVRYSFIQVKEKQEKRREERNVKNEEKKGAGAEGDTEDPT
jgi:hypothetical protein